MNKRFSTIVFVPHARAKFRKIRVSHRLLATAATVVTVSLILSGWFSFQYFNTLSRTSELNRIRQENRELQTSNDQFGRSIESLRAELNAVEERTRRLAIVAGITPEDLRQQGGVGGLSMDGEATGKWMDEVDQMSFRSRSLHTDLSILENELLSQHRLLSSTPSIAPVRGILTDSYGMRRDPFNRKLTSHSGVDISTNSGVPITSPADGIVVKANWASGYGQVIYISHGYGYSTRYGHLSKIAVKAGQKVKRGDTIGYVGSTGRSTGPHLHYEVRVNGQPVNPLEYILDAF